jgi:murein L,D-transpeptidase YcbB/YkuD
MKQAFLFCFLVTTIISHGAFAQSSMVSSQEILPELIGPQLMSLNAEPIANILQTGSIDQVSFSDPNVIYNFYKARDFKPFWTNGESVSSRGRDAIDVMAQAEDHGLNPDNYAVMALQNMESNGFQSADEFELIMSEAVLRYARDMTGIRIKPSKIGADTGSWKPMSAEAVMNYIAESSDIEDSLHSLEPQSELYNRLKSELKRTAETAKDEQANSLSQKKFSGIIKPFQSNPMIADIRIILNVTSSGDQHLYDEPLVDAVKEFQTDNGMKDDGLIGERTFTALQRGSRQKLTQIIATMERIRWLPRVVPPRLIEVNIPRQVVQLFQDGNMVATIPVIIGTSKRQTQDFITVVKGVRFNPSWHVPPTIKAEDLLPDLRKNSEALSKKGIELVRYTSDGAVPVNPSSVNWNEVTEEDLKTFGMVQDPGDKNPLGRVRVLMPNKYDIYLHDTNSPDLFSKEYRALSSGCVRVADPKQLANFILEGHENWSDERMNEILSTTKTKEISANNMPIYLTYQTIWLDNGKLIFGSDVYDSDIKLVDALKTANKLPQLLK